MIIEKKQAQTLLEGWKAKDVTHAVHLGENLYVFFYKKKVETRMCFSYDGTSPESYGVSSDLAKQAKTNEDFFIEQNIKKYTSEIELLNSSTPLYLCSDGVSKGIRQCFTRTRYYPIYEEYSVLLTKEQSTMLKQGYEKAIEIQTKKVKTYLKRFGLSKVHVWTYDSWD